MGARSRLMLWFKYHNKQTHAGKASHTDYLACVQALEDYAGTVTRAADADERWPLLQQAIKRLSAGECTLLFSKINRLAAARKQQAYDKANLKT